MVGVRVPHADLESPLTRKNDPAAFSAEQFVSIAVTDPPYHLQTVARGAGEPKSSVLCGFLELWGWTLG